MNNLKTYVSALELQTNLREDDVKFYVLNVKALVGAINQEKALVGSFSVIVKYSRTFVRTSSGLAGGAALVPVNAAQDNK